MTETLLEEPTTTAAPFASTLADVLVRLKDFPPERIRWNPTPGTATEEDLLAERDSLVELIDSTLVEKAMGVRSAFMATYLGYFLSAFIIDLKLGKLLGADMIGRTGPNQLRLPDLSYYSKSRWNGSWKKLPNIMPVMPELAVEVLSDGNTKGEMQRKRKEYFAAGCLLVWIVDPMKETVHVCTAPEMGNLLERSDTLDGGTVLPGFTLPLETLFADDEDSAI